jgi:broad specificity phosphatase PhoE
MRRASKKPDAIVSPTPPIYRWPEIVARLELAAANPYPHRTLVYRHSETVFNALGLVTGQIDVDLTDAGRKAASELSREVPVRIDGLYCSALRRAKETARLAVANSGFSHREIIFDPRLNEVGMGTLEGQTRRYVGAFAAGDIDFCLPGGESYRSAAQRVLSAFADVCECAMRRGRESTDLIFTHAGVMRILATIGFGIDDPARMFRLKFNHHMSIEIYNKKIKVPDFWCAS